MKIGELLDKYDFSDSLLNGVDYSKLEKWVGMELTFCNTRQDDYNEDMFESEDITLLFRGVREFEMDDYEVDGDIIIDVIPLEDGDRTVGLEFAVLNDVDGDIHIIKIIAESVDFDRVVA